MTAALIVYVDEIVLTGNHDTTMSRIKCVFSRELKMKNLGNLKYFLGMEVARSSHGISVSQRKYIVDLLRETGMLGCKSAGTPMDPNVKIKMNEDRVLVDKGRYQRLVGKLIYLSHIRPDIGYIVSVVSQYMTKPTKKHMEVVYRVLRYLKRTTGNG